MVWISNHSDIDGNEKANIHAKIAVISYFTKLILVIPFQDEKKNIK